MNSAIIQEIRNILKTIPKGEYHFMDGDDFDRWAIWFPNEGVHSFINFICQSIEIIEELLKKTDHLRTNTETDA